MQQIRQEGKRKRLAFDYLVNTLNGVADNGNRDTNMDTWRGEEFGIQEAQAVVCASRGRQRKIACSTKIFIGLQQSLGMAKIEITAKGNAKEMLKK